MSPVLRNRRNFLASCAAGGVALSVARSAVLAQTQDRTKPNVLMIVVDDLGYGDLSCFGAKDMKTPHLDDLAEEGIRFTRFYANCPVCSPTRASLLTGRYPDLVGVPGVIRTHWNNSFGYLNPAAQTLPSTLKQAGYHCAAIGKWHLGLESPNRPNERGFDLFHGFLGDMMDDYYDHLRHGINYMRRNEEIIQPEGHATDLFSQWAVDYLAQRTSQDAPFFLYLAYNAPHTPIQPPEDWRDRVRSREPDMDARRVDLVALIEHMDHGIGQVLEALRQNGQDRDTLVIFVSDNGGQLNVGADNGPLRGGKQDMFEGGLLVPMFARWPGRITAGAESDQVAMTMDLFQTICEVAGAPIPEGLEGRSCLPALLGEEMADEERILIWVRREGGPHGGRAYYAIRRGDWKLLQNSPFEPYRLYNLQDDPLEERPLAENHAMARALRQSLQEHIIRAGAVPWQPPEE